MKRKPNILLFLLFAALPVTLFAQNPTTVIAFMKVPQGGSAAYLEVEQAWKKVHQKGVELGVYNGWQLWAKLHAGADDPYQFMTVQWYNDYAHYFGENAPDGWMNDVYSEDEWNELMEKTLASRVYAKEMVTHLIAMAENSTDVKYMQVGHMKVKPGMTNEYVKMETEIFKPWFEELIKRGHLTHWSFWNISPYDEGQPRYLTVQGYASVAQLTGEGEMLQPEDAGIDMPMDEIMELVQKTRDMASTEVWVLVDQVWREE